jgi:phosphate transport system permease protein
MSSPAHEKIRRLDQRPLKEAISTRGRSIIPGLTKDELIKWFFGGNAWISIVVLFLIMVSLLSQSVGLNPFAGFFYQNYHNRVLYREAGLEFVDIIKSETAGVDQLSQYLADARLGALKRLLAQAKSQGKSDDQAMADANTVLAPFDDYANKLSAVTGSLDNIVSDLGGTATDTRDALKIVEDQKAAKALYLSKGKLDEAAKVKWQDVDLTAAVKPMSDALPSIKQANDKLATDLATFVSQPPPAIDDRMKSALSGFGERVSALIASIPDRQHELDTWNPNTPVAWYAGMTDFFFGSDWISASSWQNYYGILPLLVGSLLISIVALAIAVPLGVGAGIYINQIATPWEQNLVKPAIEFISAIPSVVLGFFGVAILGQTLRDYSQEGLLCFVPTSIANALPAWLHSVLAFSFLPTFSERLNIMTAGMLLAFMAVPTIFTLTEDAINNVPRAFKEASYALGANRLQTIWRIIIPASLSGVISAVLLGFGRVIGETMVVLLCAGNRIAIPPLSDGLMILFQPVHTMTGIIAQELGEAENGSIEWRALFMIGLLLFVISLFINFFAQRVVQRYKISIG